MTPEAQRIAIAEACGYAHIRVIEGRGPVVWIMHEGHMEEVRVPKYLSDLNAMHEAEKVLFEKDKTIQFGEARYSSRYRTTLIHQTNGNEWHATAPQRAEAFLRTLNLWDDAQ
jgi:hypothetical protein